MSGLALIQLHRRRRRLQHLVLLSLSLNFLPTGFAYAIQSGSGIILIAGFSWIVQGQRLDAPALLGMSLIVAGVLVMHLSSKVMAH